MKTTYPIKTICEILDLTDRGVRQLVTDGILPKKSERGRYELIPTVRAYTSIGYVIEAYMVNPRLVMATLSHWMRPATICTPAVLYAWR